MRNHWRRASVALLFCALPLLAQEGGGESSKDSGMLIWQWANFLILAGLLVWLIVKQGGPALAARTRQIQEGLAAGDKAKKEAEARAAEVQKKLANLETEIAGLRKTANEEREREAERIRREAATEMSRLTRQADLEVESAGKTARLELKRFAATLALDLAEQQIRERMTPEIQTVLMRGFIGGLDREALPDQHVKQVTQ
jgi:F-type H+-transporting ATPase subunit b